MKKTIIFLILMNLTKITYSQIRIGLLHDLNGLPLNGYFDPLIYSPEKKISKIHSSDSYEVGYYYDKTGGKIDGLIKFENDKIFFKKKKEDFRIKITPEEISRFVIGVDSFFVTNNFYFKNVIKDKPEFVQYITEFKGNTFAKHYHFTSVGMQPFITETFLVKPKDSLIWDNFPDNDNFKERALKYFSDIPYLAEKISSGVYKSKNMLSIIKMAEYFNKYNNAELILYDKYWQEVIAKDKAEYSAKIVNKTDSIWTFDYYKDSVKIYQANYSSFYPNTKNGDFISYYPDGYKRQMISYKDNKPTEVKIHNHKGLLNTHYQLIENKNEYTSKTNIDVVYLLVNDSLGNNILKENNESTIKVYDDFNKISYTSNFKNNELFSSYRLMDADTIFQITSPDYDFRIKSLQNKFDYFMTDKIYDEALSANAQGIILVSLLIDDKGYVLKGKALNSIHPEIDKLINSFINRTLLERAEFRYKFEPYKKDKVKRYCEVVIPFEFSINRFYRRPVNYNNFYQFQWQFHQQMMNNSISIPRGF